MLLVSGLPGGREREREGEVGDVREVAVEGVALLLKLLGELELVVVLQDGVGDDDERDVEAHGVQDRPRA